MPIRRRRNPATGDILLKKTFTIPHAQILTLPTYNTGAFDIIAAPGAGKAIVFHQGIIISNISVDYTNLHADLAFQCIIDPGNFDNPISNVCGGNNVGGANGHSDRIVTTQSWKIISMFTPRFNFAESINFAGSSFAVGWGMVAGLNLLENGKLSFIATNANGDFTGGDAANSLSGVVYYDIIDV